MKLRFKVEHIFSGKVVDFKRLKDAVKYSIEEADTANLILCGNINLDYYRDGDTEESLYQRCEEIVKRFL